jgi:dTDP-glucose 4,6-dehydratase
MRLIQNYKKRILITGGCGFIGSHLVKHFVKKYPDYLIVNFDALTYCGNMENLSELDKDTSVDNYVCLIGDIRDTGVSQYSTLRDVFNRYSITDVIHMAAESHVDKSITSPRIFFETNCLGTENLFDVAREFWGGDFEGHKIMSMITDEQFGSLGEDDEPFNESSPLDPHSPYSASKTCQYLIGKVYYETYGLPIVSLTCGNAIGGNQYPEKLVPLTIDRLINKQEIPIYGQGLQKRDWTNVHDICDAIDLLIHNGENGELYCIGGDACKANIDMVHAIINEYAEQTGEDKEVLLKLITFIPDPRGKAHDFRYDLNHSKITNELGWNPKYTFEDSVKETVSWYLNHQKWVKNIKEGTYYNKWISDYYKKE